VTLNQIDNKLAGVIACVLYWPGALFGTRYDNAIRNIFFTVITLPFTLVLAAPLIMTHIVLYFFVERVDDKRENHT